MLVFEERGKPEYREKNLSEQSREPTTNSYDAETGNRIRATLVGGERSHHCAIPAPLREGGRLGRNTPEVPLNTTWYLVTQHFGLRGRPRENYDLRVEHFKFAKDKNERTYVTFVDSNPTKTRTSSIKLQRRMVVPKMVASGGKRC